MCAVSCGVHTSRCGCRVHAKTCLRSSKRAESRMFPVGRLHRMGHRRCSEQYSSACGIGASRRGERRLERTQTPTFTRAFGRSFAPALSPASGPQAFATLTSVLEAHRCAQSGRTLELGHRCRLRVHDPSEGVTSAKHPARGSQSLVKPAFPHLHAQALR